MAGNLHIIITQTELKNYYKVINGKLCVHRMGEGLKEVWSVSVEVWEVCLVGCSDAERSWEHQQVSVLPGS